MNTEKNTFQKEERISSEKDIELLFETGHSFKCYPLRIVFLKKYSDNEGMASVMVSVPKRKFKHAVKRNRVKRLVRECYRLNKQELLIFAKENKINLQVAFLYIGQEIFEYKVICQAMKEALSVLKDKLGQ